MRSKGQEIEIKLRVESAAAARRLLRAAEFRVWKRRVLETNVMVDTADLALRTSQKLLRIREAGGTITVTFKGPPEVARYKSREELEVTASDSHVMSLILERLGFTPVFRYEKYRTEFRKAGLSGVATVDETPIGTFMELEGSPQWIDRTARKLGFGEQDYITSSYGRLYLDWCNERGIEPSHMVFGRGK
jgi:adenylate cyclase class 2